MAQIVDGYDADLNDREVAALTLTDLIIRDVVPPDVEQVTAFRAHFSEAQLAELALAVGLFLGMSKVLITLGLEPEAMPVTMMPTPGGQV